MNRKRGHSHHRTVLSIPYIISVVGVIALGTACHQSGQNTHIGEVRLSQVESIIPDTAYAQGVSGCFAGTIDDYIVVAGGCNFPERPAADGGQKAFYKEIYIGHLLNDTIRWHRSGELPDKIAYGASISNGNELLLIGGKTPDKALNNVWRLRLSKEGNALLDSLPSLPCTFDNGGASLYKGSIYVVAGNQDGVASRSVWRLALDDLSAGWQSLPDLPGQPRTQPVVTVCKGQLFVMGGFDTGTPPYAPPSLSLDAYCLDLSTTHTALTWQRIPAPDNRHQAISVAGGCGVAVGQNILCFGGVDKDIFMDALDRIYQLQNVSEDKSNHHYLDSLREIQGLYLKHPIAWYRFNPYLLVYSLPSGTWHTTVEDTDKLSRAGASAVKIDDHDILIVNGELKPGIRSPKIIRLSISWGSLS